MVPVTSKASNRLREPDPVGGQPPSEQVSTSPGHDAAKVQPLDVTGVRTVAVGTGLWVVALVALLPLYSTLDDQGRSWWLWTCGAGIALGLFGISYCRRRAAAIARSADEGPADPGRPAQV